MRILLTGSSGQVGHALDSTLRSLPGVEVIIPQRTQMDLSRLDLVRDTIRDIKPQLIINPAAYTAVDKAESEPCLAQTINGDAPGVMAEEAKKLGAALIHYSTDYVFDGSKRGSDGSLLAYTEQDATHPLNVYGSSKLAGEQAIAASGCAHLIFRTSWVYSGFGKNFLLTMLRLAKERDELKIVNDQWGAPTWAGWIAQATTDIVRQLQQASDTDAWWAAHRGIYNLTTQQYTSWQGFAQEIMQQAVGLKLLDKAPVVSGIPAAEYPTPATRPVNSTLSMQLLNEHFQIQPPLWSQALTDCLRGINTEQAA